MPTEAISKLEPHRTMYLRGFDRRGCAASLNNASASGFTVSGVFSDQADFAVLVLFDADTSSVISSPPSTFPISRSPA